MKGTLLRRYAEIDGPFLWRTFKGRLEGAWRILSKQSESAEMIKDSKKVKTHLEINYIKVGIGLTIGHELCCIKTWVRTPTL